MVEENSSHEYLPIHGFEPFLNQAAKLCFADHETLNASIRTIQTVSGTGANHLSALFLKSFLKPHQVFIPNPTWINHHVIWEIAAPDILQRKYPYIDPKTRQLDFDGMLHDLEKFALPNDVIILQACGHNPTGIDPSKEQWSILAKLIKKKGLFAVLDSAYQGFATGDPDADAWSIRHICETIFEQTKDAVPGGATSNSLGMMVCQSFSKNFGLYGERVGALHLVMPKKVQSDGAFSKLLKLTRAEISTCPRYGATIVSAILSDESLYQLWRKDLDIMSRRIKLMRSMLRQKLQDLGSSRDWSFLESQVGMFSYTGLDARQALRLREEFSVYLLSSGRISMSGLNESNVEYVAQAFHEVTKNR